MVGRASLHPEDGLEGQQIIGVGSQAVDGLRGKGDQATFPENLDGLEDVRGRRHGLIIGRVPERYKAA
jgi:hypothetical protein